MHLVVDTLATYSSWHLSQLQDDFSQPTQA